MKKVVRGSEQVFYETEERLWLTADQTELVKDGDERANTLHLAPGDLIAEQAAINFGLVKGKKKAASENSDGEFPHHTGGGWYLLSNGEKVHGKVAAKEAEAIVVG